MEALALAPALGVDAAALVGLVLRAMRRHEAASVLQAAWRGQRERRLRFTGRTLRETGRAFDVETQIGAFMHGAMRGGHYMALTMYTDHAMVADVETNGMILVDLD
jgi:hypothetical protein